MEKRGRGEYCLPVRWKVQEGVKSRKVSELRGSERNLARECTNDKARGFWQSSLLLCFHIFCKYADTPTCMSISMSFGFCHVLSKSKTLNGKLVQCTYGNIACEDTFLWDFLGILPQYGSVPPAKPIEKYIRWKKKFNLSHNAIRMNRSWGTFLQIEFEIETRSEPNQRQR